MAKQVRRPYYRDDDFLKKTGKRIREVRQQKGMTQMQLAFLCNEADYSQINRIERGTVNFTLSFLALIASKLEVTPQELLPID